MFIEALAKSKTGDWKVLIALDHISNVIEARKGCQVIMKNGDIMVLTDKYSSVKEAVAMRTAIYNADTKEMPKIVKSK